MIIIVLVEMYTMVGIKQTKINEDIARKVAKKVSITIIGMNLTIYFTKNIRKIITGIKQQWKSI